MTTEQQRGPVLSAFESKVHAERALGDLRDAGFKDEEVGWAMRQEEAPEGAHDVASGATAGALTGGVLGGIGAAAAMALIPGIGPFIAGGALATIAATAGASAAAGGLLGGLAGLGAEAEEAQFYDDEFRAGRPVMSVTTDDRRDEVEQIFQRSGGYNYGSRRGGTDTIERDTERIVVTADDRDVDDDGRVTEYTRTTVRADEDR